MGLLTLLTLPISAPLLGGKWVLQTLLDEAQRQYYDTAAIRQQLAEAEQRFLRGEIDEGTFDRIEEDLLLRLVEARDFHQSKQDNASV
jgi:hypothetical protein